MEKRDIKELEAMIKAIGGTSYASLIYRNKYNEKAQYLLNFGIQHKNALTKDLADLPRLRRELYADMAKNFDAITIGRAFLKVKNSIKTSLDGTNIYSIAQKNAYVWINGGMKLGIESRELYLFAYVQDKKVIEKGEYPKVNSKPLTLAVAFIDKHLRRGKYRQFVITEEQLERVKTGGDVLEFGEV